MAQTIEVPLGIEYRTFPTLWTVEYGTVDGWCLDQDGNETYDGVRVSLPRKPALLTLPVKELGLTEKHLDELESPDYTDIAKLCREHKVKLLYGERTKRSIRECDAWAMREELFRIKQDDASLLDFLNKWGSWKFAPWGTSCEYVPPVAVWELRETIREALRGSAPWFGNPLSALSSPYATREFPYFILRCDGIASALTSTVTFDLLRKTKFKLCARKDCRAPFPIESKHPKRYCQQYCAHLESVRKQRREARKAARAAKRKK